MLRSAAWLALAIGLLLRADFAQAFWAFEWSMPCGSFPWGHPTNEVVGSNADATSRYVYIVARWNYDPSVTLGNPNIGLELKTYNYNYDGAAARGMGPAYALSPAASYFRCDLPGCYIDSDFASNKNSYGEYNEPQVAFGIDPLYGLTIQPNTDYAMVVRVVAGRGDRALLKARNYLTIRVANIGVSGIFLCDNTAQSVIEFPDRVFAPSCARVSLSKTNTRSVGAC